MCIDWCTFMQIHKIACILSQWNQENRNFKLLPHTDIIKNMIWNTSLADFVSTSLYSSRENYILYIILYRNRNWIQTQREKLRFVQEME